MKRYVEIELGGAKRRIRFDFNAVVELEEYFNKGIGAILNEEQVGFRVMRAMYWAGMKTYNRKLTIEQVGKWLQEEVEGGKGLDELFEPVTEALKASGLLGEADDEQEDGEEKN